MSGPFFPANLLDFEAQAVQLDRRDDRSGLSARQAKAREALVPDAPF